MIQCDYCRVEFEIIFEVSYDTSDIVYCPCCGEELNKDLDFNDE